MLRYFQRIVARAEELGNHRRKYLHGIEKHGRELIDRLEESGNFDRVHLRQLATDYATEMDAVLEVGSEEPEKLRLLGCYYAIQYLQLNTRSIDLLRLNSSSAPDPMRVYREFIRGVAEDFASLMEEYLKRLLEMFLAAGPQPQYFLCTVGTRLHQDDVDLGIFDDGGPHRRFLNKAIGKMAREMMRWTSDPDFYLSGSIGKEGYSISLEEYRSRLDRQILDFVSVSEILSAHRIAGSEELFERFRDEVHNRYHYRGNLTAREHEGYLRGLVGEIESLLLWPHDPKIINPKDDLLRLVIGVLCTYRTMSQLHEPDNWATLGQLTEDVLRRQGLPETFEQDYTFVETFRHLYQQFAAPEEEIDLTDPQEQESLQHVAKAMGYEDVGVIQAWQQLVIHYHEHVKAGRETVRALLPGICSHIRRVTVFADWLRAPLRPQVGRQRENLAIDFVRRVRYFLGIKYWDDLLEDLEAQDSPLLRRLIDDLMALDPVRRRQIINTIAHWGYRTFYTMLRLLNVIGRRSSEPDAREVYAALHEAFLNSIEGNPDEIRRFTTVFTHYPNLVYRYISTVDQETLSFLAEKLSGTVWDSKVIDGQQRLMHLCEIERKASRFFKRAIDRVCERQPETLLYFGDLAKLQQVSKGMLADLVRMPSYTTRKQELISYYDLEYLRIGLATLQGRPLAQLDAEFTEFADYFLQTLFDTCKAEVDADVGKRILTHDLLGVFVAGGHARERAHQDDYDLVVLLNSDDEEIHDYSNRILTYLNRAIIRCGLIPQYRFADRFGGYVTRFSELEEFLKTNAAEACVEMSQLIGARLIVGSSRLEKEFVERIIEGCIYTQKGLFSRTLAEELQSRHAYEGRQRKGIEYDVKECRGGLRDLEMAQLLWKALYEIREPIGGRFWDVLAEDHPDRRGEFKALKESYHFLNRLRDVYRLSVAPQNHLDPAHLELPAEVLGYRDTDGVSATDQLERDLHHHCERVASRLVALVAEVVPS